jgi:hypothetical protein
MTTKTIPEYLEDERQKDCDAQMRMEAEAARIQHLNHHHRGAKQPKLESPSVVKAPPVKAPPKARKTAAQAREKPRAVRKTATKTRKAA